VVGFRAAAAKDATLVTIKKDPMYDDNQNLDIRCFYGSPLTECWIHSRADHNADAGILDSALDWLSQHRLVPVWMRLFGDTASLREAQANLQRRQTTCPPALIVQDYPPPLARFQMQMYAVSGVQAAPVYRGDTPIGIRYEDDWAEYTLLRLLPRDAAADKASATRSIFEQAEAILADRGGSFADTVRTWLFADDILAWYDQLNAARNQFFTERAIYGRLVPASTGVGTANLPRAPLTAQLLAMQPKNGSVQIAAVPSPLQCPALDYKSSFSRAVAVRTPTCRRLYVSGTAAIDRSGNSAFAGDPDRQIDLTMQVIAAILKETHTGWSEVVNALVYFKRLTDFGRFDDYCRRCGLVLPHLKVAADVCRPELLFEIELETLTPQTGREN